MFFYKTLVNFVRTSYVILFIPESTFSLSIHFVFLCIHFCGHRSMPRIALCLIFRFKFPIYKAFSLESCRHVFEIFEYNIVSPMFKLINGSWTLLHKHSSYGTVHFILLAQENKKKHFFRGHNEKEFYVTKETMTGRCIDGLILWLICSI